MPKAWLGSIDIAQKKAFTARAFNITTKDLAANSQSGDQFFGIHASNDGKIMIFAGGIPIKQGDMVIGAIGVSGGSGEQDHAVAEAGGGGGLGNSFVLFGVLIVVETQVSKSRPGAPDFEFSSRRRGLRIRGRG